MSDTDINAVMVRNIDAIDEAWVLDYLSDDDIEVPNDMHLNDDDEDDEEEEASAEQKQSWNDLGLERFVLDVQAQTTFSMAAPSPQPQGTPTA